MDEYDALISKVKEFLGEEGIKFFRNNLEKYGTVSLIYVEELEKGLGVPHSIHFREGIQVRNFMRSTGLCNDWDSNDFDDNWITVVELAIK